MKRDGIVFFLFCSILFNVYNSNAQSDDWWWAVNPNVHASGGNSIVTDGKGFSYVTGTHQGGLTYFGNFPINSGGWGSQSTFIAKYDTSGNVTWAKGVENLNGIFISSTNASSGISLDEIGNCFITGSFYGAFLLENDTLVSSDFSEDIFIAKYDTSGILQWVRRDGGNSIENAMGIVSDSMGNSYISGLFRDTTIFGNDTLVSSGISDIFIAAYDPYGNLRWIRKGGGNTTDEGLAITMNGDNSVLVTGHYRFNAIFGTDTLVSNGVSDIFLAKYDSSGNLVWLRNAGGTDHDNGRGVSSDQFGNIYLTGFHSDSAIFGNDTLYGNGIFIAKYDSSGLEQWVKHETTNAWRVNDVNSISTDADGNSYIGGWFADTLIFSLDTLFGGGLYVTKFNSAGDVLWMLKSVLAGDCMDVSADKNGYCFVTGLFSNTITLGSITLNCIGLDLLTAKIGCISPTPEINVINGMLHATQALTYQWYLNGNLLTGANAQDYTPPQNGDYVVLISDTNGCIGYSEQFYYGGVGTSEAEKENLIYVYPNPSSGIFNFDITVSGNEIKEIKITNLLGKEIYYSKGKIVDFTGYSNGVYFYSLKANNDKVFYGKIVKE